MCFGVCGTKHVGKISKTFIKSQMQLASPTPSCVVSGLVCLLFLCTLKAIRCSPKTEPSSLSLVCTDVDKVPFSLSLREHVFSKQREVLSFLSTSTSLPLSHILFQSLASSLFRTREVMSWHAGPQSSNTWTGLVVLIPIGDNRRQAPECFSVLDPCSQGCALLPGEPLLVRSGPQTPHEQMWEGLPSMTSHSLRGICSGRSW